MELTGAEITVRCLQEEGVEYVFGYPGGAVLHIYDAFFKQEEVVHVLVRHEQAATHAADGYARAAGKTGVGIAHLARLIREDATNTVAAERLFAAIRQREFPELLQQKFESVSFEDAAMSADGSKGLQTKP